MRTRLAVLAAALLLAISAAPVVQGATINERIDNMERRIDQGVRSGELTRPEADRLRGELRDIKQREHRMRADGKLGPRERDALNADLDRLDKHVARQKHDADKRPRAR